MSSPSGGSLGHGGNTEKHMTGPPETTLSAPLAFTTNRPNLSDVNLAGLSDTQTEQRIHPEAPSSKADGVTSGIADSTSRAADQSPAASGAPPVPSSSASPSRPPAPPESVTIEESPAALSTTAPPGAQSGSSAPPSSTTEQSTTQILGKKKRRKNDEVELENEKSNRTDRQVSHCWTTSNSARDVR